MKPYFRPALFLLLISLSNASYSDPYKIAFGSCLDQDIPQPIWSTIQKDEVNAFIFLGDNVYGDDDSSGELDTLRAAYSKQRSILFGPEYQRSTNGTSGTPANYAITKKPHYPTTAATPTSGANNNLEV